MAEKIVEFQTTDAVVRRQMEQIGGAPPVEENFVSLQNHGTPVWFGNLKVRRLN